MTNVLTWHRLCEILSEDMIENEVPELVDKKPTVIIIILSNTSNVSPLVSIFSWGL